MLHRHRPRPLLGIALLVLLALLAPAASASAAGNPWLSQRFLDFAHQGGEDEMPSNTMYALKRAQRAGVDALELDVGYTKDDHLVVLHDNTVDRTTNGTGSVNELTLAQVQKLDAAYWFVPGRNAVHGLPASRYPLRGVRTGQRRPPNGYTRDDFRIPTLDEVLRAFPHTPINVEIKGRDGSGDDVFFHGADLLAKLLNQVHRTDVIVVSFNQKAVDRFHAQAPRVPVAPGVDGMASFLLSHGSPGAGVVAFQLPITYELLGHTIDVTTPDTVRRAHEAGYAVHVWLSDDTENVATYRRLIGMCVDGIMAAKPLLLERLLEREHVVRPDGSGEDPCGTAVSARSARVHGATVTLPMRRRGRSMERRAGTVTLREGRRALGRGRFVLADGASATTVRVRLTAAGRRALRATRALHVAADVRERVPASRSAITLRRG